MFKSIEDVKKYIEATVKKYSHKFVSKNYTIRYSNRQRRALASVRTHYILGNPVRLEFVFSNNYLKLYEYNEANIKDTVLHEIAHAIVGGHHHHDSVWKSCCYELGCEAKRFKHVNRGGEE